MRTPLATLPVPALLAVATLLAACGDGGTTTVTETVAASGTTTSSGETTTTSSTERTTTAEDVVEDCPDLSTNITGVSVRNTSCEEVLALMSSDLGSISKTFTLGSYECRRIEGGRLGGVWRCTAGEMAIRFSFGD